jgi:hypothetical protein
MFGRLLQAGTIFSIFPTFWPGQSSIVGDSAPTIFYDSPKPIRGLR